MEKNIKDVNIKRLDSIKSEFEYQTPDVRVNTNLNKEDALKLFSSSPNPGTGRKPTFIVTN